MEKQKADAIITRYLEKIYGFAFKKSYSYDEDCSDGYDMYYFEEGMSCGAPLYFGVYARTSIQNT